MTSRWTTPCGVGMGERVAQRDPDRDDVAVRQPPGSSSAVERRAADQLGDQIGALVVDRRLVQGHDARVGQPRGRPGLALEAPSHDPLARQDLDRHVALQPLVTRHPDGAERAGAEPAVQPVAVEDHRSRPSRRGGARASPVAAVAAASRAVRQPGSALMDADFPRRRCGPCERERPGRCAAELARATCELAYPAVPTVILASSQVLQGAIPLVVLRRGGRPRTPPRTRTAQTPAIGDAGRRPPGDQQSIQARRAVAAVALLIVIILIALGVHSCQVSAAQQLAEGLRQQRLVADPAVRPDRQRSCSARWRAAAARRTRPASRTRSTRPGSARHAELSHARRPERPGPGQGGAAEPAADAADARRRDHQRSPPRSSPRSAPPPARTRSTRSPPRWPVLRLRRALQGLHRHGDRRGAARAPGSRSAAQRRVDHRPAVPAQRAVADAELHRAPSCTSRCPHRAPRQGHARAARPSLDSVSVAGTTLQTGSTNTIPASPAPTFTLNFTNGGTNNETNVVCKVSVTGTSSAARRWSRRPSPGQHGDLQGDARRSSPARRHLHVVATIEPVPGEKNMSNNSLSFPVTFQ